MTDMWSHTERFLRNYHNVLIHNQVYQFIIYFSLRQFFPAVGIMSKNAQSPTKVHFTLNKLVDTFMKLDLKPRCNLS